MRIVLSLCFICSIAFAAPPDLGPVRPLKVPPGFEVIKVAGPPLVDRPVVACFDDKGRLYVADSSGSNEKPTIQLEKKPHRIVMLEDTDGDGIFDKSTVFADNMMFLQGVMWKDGSLYVGAPPHIWKLTDTTGSGKADKREIWFDGKTLTGCANDLHGPYAGPDGYIYWTKGAFAKQEYSVPLSLGGRGVRGEGDAAPATKKISTRCAMILRAKPDGSNLEPVMFGGMDNPVDVVFLPNGERIFSTTFLQNPANGQRDGLIHAIYGAVYGKDHDPVYELPWTAPTLMPPMTHMGPAAPAGLHRYERDQLGSEFTGNLFCAQFNLRTVSRHILKSYGSTYVTYDSPFVTSDDVDFHPTDVIEDTDGSLLVIDTGGWYKLCCPSSQLVKTDVLGGIYRIRKIGSHKTKTKPTTEPLPPLYWASLNRDPKSYDLAIAGLKDSNLHTRRLAAEALGRIGDKRAVPELYKAIEQRKNDRVLFHSINYALIELGDVETAKRELNGENMNSQWASLIVLNAIPNSLKAKDVVRFVEKGADNISLRQTAWWVLSKHPEWGPDLKDFVKERLGSRSDGDNPLSFAARNDEVYDMQRFFGLLSKSKSIQDAIAEILENPNAPLKQKTDALQVIFYSRLPKLPVAWINALTLLLSKDDYTIYEPFLLNVTLEYSSTNSEFSNDYVSQLYRITQDRRNFELRGIRALASLPENRQSIDNALLGRLMYQFEDLHDSRSIIALKKVNLTDEQWLRLINFISNLNATKASSILSLFDRTRSEPVGLALVKALNTPEMRAKIRIEQVKPILDKYPDAVKKEAENLYAELEKSRAGEIAKFESLIKELPPGDIRRGQVVFHSQKANCKACHTIGYVGGKVGPDLTRIGGIRTERDLLESIVFPSASFVRSYEPVRINTKDGRTFNGNVKSDSGGEVILTVAADQEVRISRDNIEEMVPGQVSVMPSGLDQQMSKQELADLVAFLKANK